jgi:DNA-binding protein Fis
MITLSETRISKPIFIVFIVLVAALVLDTSFIRIYSYSSNNQLLSNSRFGLFLVIFIVYAIGQVLLLEFVKRKSREIRNKQQLHLKMIHRIVTIAQYILTALLVVAILEMILTSEFSTLLVALIVGISYTLAIILLGLLAQRFFSWFRANRNSVVLLYGLSSAMLAINAIFTLIFVGSILLNSEPYVQSYSGASLSPFISPGSLADILNLPYIVSTIMSFTVCWIATIMILRHYSSKLRKIRYGVILSLPLVYFLLQFLPPFQSLITSLPESEYVFFLYIFIFTFSKAVGGILFGIAFWVIARTLGHTSVVRGYIIISAYGLILLFISNQAILLVNIIYPPLGIVTISLMGLSSYLILIGIYSSAISVSEDSKLRQTIRSLTTKESKLLDSIGIAQMEQEIEKRVLSFTKQNQDRMAEETGIQSSLSEEDMKQYLQEVIREVKGKASDKAKE